LAAPRAGLSPSRQAAHLLGAADAKGIVRARRYSYPGVLPRGAVKSRHLRVRELADILEKVLLKYGHDGIRYAPIFLQRKKALHPRVRVDLFRHVSPFGLARTCALQGDSAQARAVYIRADHLA